MSRSEQEAPVICDVCKKPLAGEEKEFAEEQGAHAGYLGLVCPVDYKRICNHDPTVPWTDPISGETDYGEMESDLGFSGGEDDSGEGQY